MVTLDQGQRSGFDGYMELMRRLRESTLNEVMKYYQ